MQAKPYSECVEVEASEMTKGVVLDKAKYAFYEEVAKRLEQTNPKTALRYKFQDADSARLYRQYVTRLMLEGRGEGTIRTTTRQNGAGVYVYFARGGEW